MTSNVQTGPQRADGAIRRPATLEEALAFLHRESSLATVCMGGTDLVPRLRQRPDLALHLVCCSRLSELQQVAVSADTVEIGAGVTYRALTHNHDVRKIFPALAALAGTIGNPRVRNRGTLGGAICAARARSDPPTLLTALGAQAVLSSSLRHRSVPIDRVVRGHRATALAPDEMLTCVRIPRPSPLTRIGFERVGSSQGPIVNVALSSQPSSMQLVIGGIGPTPQVVSLQSGIDVSTIADIARRAAGESWASETSLGSRWYCSELAARLAGRLLARLREPRARSYSERAGDSS